ncbi:hypothetical protein J31TS4_27690 [Paenibacillus sp. J31TS4]|uniref:DUF4855 domain-containing protein n=1 Tax=Paenibacillus sp. J31TS4 TaxID=2807195 RepID=UPI001B12EF43|nr:DUF4855 domain-containing protein [Paenibacillus sp. J31TS4]GIP39489.1 hypothetical protein J31TS4_27690 [Paenibacillus sp. J31TS4]
MRHWKARLSQWLAAGLVLAMIAPAAGDVQAAEGIPGVPAGNAAAVSGNVYGDVYSNLALGKLPVVKLVSGDAAQTAKEAAMAARLTDGVLGNGDWERSRTLYVDFYRNVGRQLYVDLGGMSTVKEIRFRAMQDASAGIYLPQHVGFSLSHDGGRTWSYLGSVPAAQAEAAPGKAGVFKLDGLNYAADQVRITFPVDVWIFADELEVLGRTGIVDGAVPPPPGDTDPYEEVNAYPAPGSEQTRGARNDYLVYAGWHTNGTVRHDKTKEMLLPAAAYVAPDGTVKDTLFDSFTFLPYATGSSGRSLIYKNGGTADQAAGKQDWQEYIDFLFDDRHQLTALNEAVGETKAALNRPDYRATVKLAIPNPLGAQTNFDEIGGKQLNFNQTQVGDAEALANRIQAVQWYVDQILQRWDPAKYPNLRLDGFYWLDEAVHTYLDSLEESVIRATTAYVHEKGKIIFWIPFYQSPGFEKWKALGFDYAEMQPNYAFDDVAPVTRPSDAAALAKRYGLGVEMELRTITTEAGRQKFKEYLNQGVTAGYMNGAVRGWYMGTLTLQEANASQVPAEREIYELTYRSVKGTYPDAPGQTTVNLAAGRTPAVTLISGDQAQKDKEAAMMPRLTDGVLGTGDWSKGRDKYVDFYRSIGRSVELDLGQLSTVREIGFRTLQDTSAGIGIPAGVAFSLSDDGGRTWRYLGTVPGNEAEPADAKHKVFKLSGLNYKADRIKVGFDVSVWIFADELSVKGQPGVAEDAVQAPDLGYDDPYKEVNAFPAPGSEQVRGTRNDYLIYAGWHTDGTVKEEKTVEKLLPAVAYLDASGAIKDMLFDSFTFLPYATGSSGRSLVTAPSADKAGNKADFQEYMDFLFDETNQLAALDRATAQAKEALGRPDYRAKVKIAIPRPLPVQTDFGTVDGKPLNFNAAAVGDEKALANRAAAAKWYIDEVTKRWDPAKYPNLRLDGFYWLHESIEVLPNNGEERMLQAINAYIHEKGLMSYWIPFYQANGFFKWKSLGFDYAILQPNYAFYDSPDNRPTEAAELAKRFGLGIEIEIHWNGLTVEADRQKFLRYLDQGVTAGYMNDSVRAWYMGTDTLQQANASTVPTQREVYDKTYASIKGVYPDFPDLVPPAIGQPARLSYIQSEEIRLAVPVTDEGSGVQEVAVSLDGQEGAAELVFAPATLAVGDHEVRVRAIDRAGNRSEAVFTLTVTIDLEHLDDVIQAGIDSERIHHSGIATALQATVQLMQREVSHKPLPHPATALKVSAGLKAMEAQVSAQAGRTIEREFAELLLEDIQELRKQIGK